MYEESAKVAQQMIDMQRTIVEGMIGNMIIFWDQTGSICNSFLNQAAWMPEEGKKALHGWIDGNKTGCETLKEYVINGYANLGKYFERKA